MRVIIAIFLLVSCFLQPAVAQDKTTSPFRIPKSLQSSVDFWVLIYTRYGKSQLVFHHREEPSIIYSVLDLEAATSELAGKELEKLKVSAVKQELERIKTELNYLAEGNVPTTPFQRRLERLFSIYPKNEVRAKYREATNDDKLRYQSGIKERFKLGVARSTRYLHAIERIFQEQGLPYELSRLPLVESSFDYEAYSSVGAAGIWQFMPRTGRQYLRIDANRDERRDPIIATRAAAKYLKHAYEVLEEWPLAVTSYNHGIQGMLKASKETGSKDLSVIINNYKGSAFGFASKNFYAEFLAALVVERNPQHFFPDITMESPVYFEEVQIGKSLSWSRLANLAGLSSEALSDLNPAFMSTVTSGKKMIPEGSYVKVPKGKGKQVVASIGNSSQVSFVEAPIIATPKTEKSKTVVTSSRSTKKSASTKQTGKTVTKYYVVQKGDTLFSISKRIGVSVETLKKLNGNSSVVKTGTKIKLK